VSGDSTAPPIRRGAPSEQYVAVRWCLEAGVIVLERPRKAWRRRGHPSVLGQSAKRDRSINIDRPEGAAIQTLMP